MDEYSILALPEIREMVFSHLNEEDTRETVIVSPTFYNTICNLEQNKIIIEVNRFVSLKTFL